VSASTPSNHRAVAGVKTAAIVLAGGQSSRMGFDKMFADLDGQPVLAHSIAVFESCSDVAIIVVVASVGSIDRVRSLVEQKGWSKVRAVVTGGDRRQDSVAAGLDRVPDSTIVAIHDGARPLVTAELISAGIRHATVAGGAVPVVPVADTIKVVDSDGAVLRTLDRTTLRAAQTPQVFRTEIIQAAHRAIHDEATDDATMVERIGATVIGYSGDRRNLKITTPEDLDIARALLRSRQ
jgi:2-C-methyl-D-erythritol 4-phosphate cytidylyltransferase